MWKWYLPASQVSMEHCGLSLDVRWIRSLTLTQQYFEYANSPPSGKDWEMGISVFCLCTEFRGTAMARTIKNYFPVCYSLQGPRDTSFTGFRARCFGGHPSGQRLKCWGATGWVQPLHTSQAGIFKFSPDCVLLCWGWVFWKEFISVFLILFAVGFSSFAQCAGVTHPVSGFLSEATQRIFFCVQL